MLVSWKKRIQNISISVKQLYFTQGYILWQGCETGGKLTLGCYNTQFGYTCVSYYRPDLIG